jgi:hypothetical protein
MGKHCAGRKLRRRTRCRFGERDDVIRERVKTTTDSQEDCQQSSSNNIQAGWKMCTPTYNNLIYPLDLKDGESSPVPLGANQLPSHGCTPPQSTGRYFEFKPHDNAYSAALISSFRW